MTVTLRGVHGINSVLITESAAIRIDYNLVRVYYFTHTTQGPCDSPNRPKLDKGVLASTVPHMARLLRVRPACAWRLCYTSCLDVTRKFNCLDAKRKCNCLDNKYGYASWMRELSCEHTISACDSLGQIVRNNNQHCTPKK